MRRLSYILCLLLVVLVMPGAMAQAAEIMQPISLKVGNERGTERRMRAFLEVEALEVRFEDAEINRDWWWAVFVMERDPNSGRNREDELRVRRFNTARFLTLFTPEGGSRVPEEVLASQREGLIVYTPDPAPDPLIRLDNLTCPRATGSHPEGSCGPDDIIALIGGGMLRPTRREERIERIKVLFPADIPVVDKPDKEYYAVVVHRSVTGPPLPLVRSLVTFTNIH